MQLSKRPIGFHSRRHLLCMHAVRVVLLPYTLSHCPRAPHFFSLCVTGLAYVYIGNAAALRFSNTPPCTLREKGRPCLELTTLRARPREIVNLAKRVIASGGGRTASSGFAGSARMRPAVCSRSPTCTRFCFACSVHLSPFLIFLTCCDGSVAMAFCYWERGNWFDSRLAQTHFDECELQNRPCILSLRCDAS